MGPINELQRAMIVEASTEPSIAALDSIKSVGFEPNKSDHMRGIEDSIIECPSYPEPKIIS